MFRMGDEFLHTQGGNSNPYNQDNETSWLDWSRLKKHAEMFEFARRMIAFRKEHPTLCRSEFWRDDVEWFGPQGEVDFSPQSREIAFLLRGESEGDSDLFVLINGSEYRIPFSIPFGGRDGWRRRIDTSVPAPDEIVRPKDGISTRDEIYAVAARSVVVLTR